MSLASNIVLNDGQTTPVAHTFSATKVAPDGTERIDTATTIVEPSLFVIKHSPSGKGATVSDRHLCQLSLTKKDALGVSQTLVTNLTVAVPRNVVITRAMINDHLAYVKNFIATSTNVDAILRNES